MEKVCVTGGAGFIGSNIVRTCLERGLAVRVIDDFSTGRRENLTEVEAEIELFEGDIRDKNLLEKTLADVDTVFHQAAMPSVPRSMGKPGSTTEITFNGTLNLYQVAAELDVNRVVFASSSSIYGNQPGFPRREGMALAPASPYAAAKASCELFGQVFAEQFPVETIGLRYFNVFGPHQNPESEYAAVVPSFITAVLADEQPVVYGDGEQSRDFTFVQDVADANLAAAQEGENGQVYNVARNKKTTVNKLLELILELTGNDIQPRHDPPRPGDVRCSYGDNQLFQEATGFSPQYSVKEGLEQTIEWYRNNSQLWEGN